MNLPSIKNHALMILLICANFIKDCENLFIKGKKKMFVNWGHSKLKVNINKNEHFKNQTLLWPKGQILYYIDDFSFDKVLKTRLRGYLEDVSAKTGLQFLEMPLPPDDNKETRWVLFINRIGQLQCQDYSSSSFTEKGVQRVVVGYDCVGPEGFGLSAAILALAGVPPQHNAPYRDKYITVMQQNIEPDSQDRFTILGADAWPFGDDSYDFFSAGHYDFYKYSRNGSATIVPKIQVDNSLVGEGKALSDEDIVKITTLYNNLKPQMKTDSEVCEQLYKAQIKNKSEESIVSVERLKGKKAPVLLMSDYNTSDN